MDKQTIIPKATLWLGRKETCCTKIVRYLQTVYCKTECIGCVTCNTIQQKQYYLVHWMTEQQYRIDDFLHIEQMILYKRDNEKPFFFVIPAVDFLSKSCANSLLKLLEGSEKNYFFFLTAEQKNSVIPTIVSRCFLNYCQSDIVQQGALVTLFSNNHVPEYAAMVHLLEQYKTKQEYEIITEYNDLLSFWLKEYAHCKDNKEKKRIEMRITLIKQGIMSGIPSGSFPFMMRTWYLRWVELCQ